MKAHPFTVTLEDGTEFKAIGMRHFSKEWVVSPSVNAPNPELCRRKESDKITRGGNEFGVEDFVLGEDPLYVLPV